MPPKAAAKPKAAPKAKAVAAPAIVETLGVQEKESLRRAMVFMDDIVTGFLPSGDVQLRAYHGSSKIYHAAFAIRALSLSKLLA